jgi:hypothetical protein
MGKSSWCLLDTRLGGIQRQSRRSGKEKSISLYRENLVRKLDYSYIVFKRINSQSKQQ